MVSQDLAEFTCTMQNDTKKVVEKTKETLQVNSFALKLVVDYVNHANTEECK